MKILSLEASNVKRIVAVHIVPEGDGLVVIGGQNANGKSSVLDSIAMAIGGGNSIPKRAIRDGEETAEIILRTEEFTITRKLKSGGNPTLVITGADNVPMKSPQALLDSLTSQVSFDPLAFTRMRPAEQAETVQRLVGIDFSKLEKESEQAYEARTVLNRDVKRMQSLLQAMPHNEDAGLEPKSASAISERLMKATAENAANEKRRGQLDDANDSIAAAKQKAADAEAECVRLRALLATANEYVQTCITALNDQTAHRDSAAKACDALVDVEIEPIQAELRDVEAFNKKVDANIARADAVKALKEKEDAAKKKTERIEAIDAEIKKTLRKTKFPIEGLSFSGGGVTYKGLPFEYASAAEQMRVSVAIGAALQPKLKVVLIRDGSLLDTNGLKLLAEIAEEYGMQCWVERVGEGAECSVIIEAGEVKETR